MRRMMYRICESLAYRVNAKCIVNGESVGQVASQTLTSMMAINEVIKMPVIRPVACFDKLDIIDISKKINTYDISIRPFEDCCTIFVPEHPVINPDINKARECEKLFDYEWQDSGICVKALDNIGNPKKCDESDNLVKAI